MAEFPAPLPAIGSILLASTDPGRLRGWYERAFGVRQRGVAFEEVNAGGLRTVNGIAEVTGNYPSAGGGERAAWFRDSEGNLLGIGQVIPPPPQAGD